ncbi:MAG: hypothetical protein FJX77_09540 [Armatimonadetes bacterium]|nr:hypothetical protein [Armatimonadota bacterium]
MVITTHSPDLVDAAHPDEVRVVARDSIGATELERLNPSDYDRWQHDFRLGELWRLRQLGGVP